ncbi:unnamed protein product [Parascedosporium putredinis]|uniref:Nudix hydrolase domain-containing protein n=1 Tax=Parascedosporium putredinis TaxID=1442378 RepID=A0A9P1H0T1_9PEZI|nr:unnamed protein product [Parascedosporium putredinis]CAI7994247.1 unnamed protein product [Parascedosporium putredinis]
MANDTSSLPFSIPADLLPFTEPLPVFRSKEHPFISLPFTHYIASSLVFEPNEGRLLIVQRSATDYGAHMWELPGGTVDPHESVLEGRRGTPRGVWTAVDVGEMRRRTARPAPLRRFRDCLRPRAGQAFGGGRPEENTLWCRIAFMVEVEDYARVTLDPEEHQAYLWVTETEVRTMRTQAGRELEFASEPMRATMLEGFRVGKAKKRVAAKRRAGAALQAR